MRLSIIIIRSFSQNQRNTFGYLGPVFGALFRLPEFIGEYIRNYSEENEKLFVYGDHPSIYLYAKRQAFDTNYLFIYSHCGRIRPEKDLIDGLRQRPPELFLFYNYQVNDGWSMDKVQKRIGVPYKFLRSFRIADNQGKTLENAQGIVYDFPLYRRDDEKYKEILLDRAIAAKSNANRDEAMKNIRRILELFPQDFEASVWNNLMENHWDDAKNAKNYLKKELAMNDDPMKRSVALRLLADIDFSDGDSESGLKKHLDSLNYNPHDFRIYNSVGEIYFSMGHLEKAFQAFKKAIELNPYSADVLNNMGVVLANFNKTEDAAKCFDKAISFMPAHPDALNNLESLGFSHNSA
ncbi:MAG: tetratricopeptide repeat protein [Thermodesulfobacteriota bacterium]|nr:tetratricopeptide repeat protein [Thermodesulfobacteriota bacterium]